jgi:hypothetical protein
VGNATCSQAECTVTVTGKCLLFPTVDECPHYQSDQQVDSSTSLQLPDEQPILEGGRVVRRFHSGVELGTDDACEIMRPNYGHLIALIGQFDAGKTCFLSSLYLLASLGGLKPRYSFASSLTLRGFEDRARLVRVWDAGTLPNSLADHTPLTDPRRPALLHLGLYDHVLHQRFDVLLTDLPGEWTKSLIQRSSAIDHFAFLKRADAIVIAVDGTTLHDAERRHVELQQARVLLQRLAESGGFSLDVPVILMLTKCDLIVGDATSPAIELVVYAKTLGLNIHLFAIAAFSSKAGTPSGKGVEHVLSCCLAVSPKTRKEPVIQTMPRMMQRYVR